jgi:hypothetical protein
MGRLSAKDKVRLARLKLRGAARIFYASQPELRADDISYADFRAAFVNRFKDKHTDSITMLDHRTLPKRRMKVPK